MKNKKAISTNIIVYLIISAITLFLLAMLIPNLLSDSNYKSAINECSFFMKNINGKGAFFTGLKTPNNNLLNSLGNICPSKIIEIDKNQINEAVDLISNCYLESGKGVDFLPANLEGEGICLYCGSIKANENIDFFGKKIEEKLKSKKYSFLFKNNSDSINLNSESLNSKNINSNLNSDAEVSIFYYIFKPKSTSKIGQVQSQISSVFSNFNQFTGFISQIISSSDIKTFSLVILTNQKEYNSNQILNMDRNSLKSKNCDLIIPKKVYK